MSTHKSIDWICCAAIAVALLLTVLMVCGRSIGIQATEHVMGYETRLFSTDRVHTIDIEMDDWDSFIASCEDESYAACSMVIDNEAKKNVAIRAKGNTSLRNVSQLGSQRYSFKIEFDHYEAGKTYHGLDKLSLNNLIQDNTMMKDYLTYQMMGAFGVDAPLCSFAYLTVNGEDWGLYLAVEGVEDAFLERNYAGEGELYKPDSSDLGGGRGNGRDFEMNDDTQITDGANEPMEWGMRGGMGQRPDGMQRPNWDGEMPDGMHRPDMNGELSEFRGGGMNGNGSADVKLQYIDDDPDSYENIFDNAMTDVTTADKKRLIAALKTLSSENAADAVNVEEVLRYFVVHDFVCNGDSYTGSMIHNYYLHENDGKLSMIPWDYNLAFGTFQSSNASASVNSPIDSPVTGGSVEDRPMVAWIFDDGEYQAQYHSLYDAFLSQVDPTAIIEPAEKLIDPYVERDPTKFCTYEEFQAGVATLKSFCSLRMESIRGQLDGTIPSTTEGQRTAADSLIDASSITISDMGDMAIGMGGGGNAFAFRDEERGEAAPENFDPKMMQQPDRGGFLGDPTPPDAPQNNSRTWITLGICVLVLILDLLATCLFRRK